METHTGKRFNEGEKYDEGKTMLNLILPEFIEDLGKVLTFGATKYSPNSWKLVPRPIDRYTNSLLRHINAWRSGKFLDEESGLPHLMHAACNIMFLEHFMDYSNLRDTTENINIRGNKDE